MKNIASQIIWLQFGLFVTLVISQCINYRQNYNTFSIYLSVISGSSDQQKTKISAKDQKTSSLEVTRSEKTNNNRQSPPSAAVHSGGAASIIVTSKMASVVASIKVIMAAFILWTSQQLYYLVVLYHQVRFFRENDAAVFVRSLYIFLGLPTTSQCKFG